MYCMILCGRPHNIINKGRKIVSRQFCSAGQPLGAKITLISLSPAQQNLYLSTIQCRCMDACLDADKSMHIVKLWLLGCRQKHAYSQAVAATKGMRVCMCVPFCLAHPFLHIFHQIPL